MVMVAENNYKHMCTRFQEQNTGNFIKIIKIHATIENEHADGGGALVVVANEHSLFTIKN